MGGRNMKISVTIRNGEGDTWQKEYVEERLKKLKKYIDAPTEAHVVLSVEKFRNGAEINLIANGLNINAKEEEKDMHLAIDNAIVKIERQLKKHREKIRGHKSNSLREGETPETPVADELDDIAGTKVVEMRELILKPMSLDDALMEMNSTKNRFVVYRDAATKNISVVYRRDDGKYALIETKG
jgi:putative sigma-54 modulation protein